MHVLEPAHSRIHPAGELVFFRRRRTRIIPRPVVRVKSGRRTGARSVSMNKLWFLALLVVLATGISGCKSVAPPNWFHTGPAEYQQRRAEQFDPYPENEPGPEITGGRPREYEKPIPEVDRARWPSPTEFFRSGWLPWNWARG